jgi:5'-AMP-activated protein kinase regulatory beta subunit
VDDEWRFAPDLPTVVDIEGRINNFIDVSTFVPYTGDENYLTTAVDTSDEVYTRTMPGLDEYTKEPMALPPHLRHLILNKVPRSNEPAALTTPLHVSLNHLNCTAAKVNINDRTTQCLYISKQVGPGLTKFIRLTGRHARTRVD